jgi:hypothetical protein
MGRTWVGILAFAGGLTAGLLFADWYAKQKATSGVNSILGALGLGGGKVQTAADQLVPVIVG